MKTQLPAEEKKHAIESDIKTKRKIKDVWALLVYIILTIYVGGFFYKNFSQIDYSLVDIQKYTIRFFVCIASLFFVNSLSMMYLREYYLFTITVLFLLMPISLGLYLLIDFVQKIDNLHQWPNRVAIFSFAVLVLLIFSIFVLNARYHSQYIEKILTVSYHVQENNRCKISTFSLICAILLMIFSSTLDFLYSPFQQLDILNRILTIFTLLWTINIIGHFSSALGSSVVYQEIIGKPRLYAALDNCTYALGSICLSALMVPFTRILSFCQIKTIDPRDGTILKTLKEINNKLARTVDVLTLGLIKKSTAFVTQAIIFNSTGMRESTMLSHSITNRTFIQHLNRKDNLSLLFSVFIGCEVFLLTKLLHTGIEDESIIVSFLFSTYVITYAYFSYQFSFCKAFVFAFTECPKALFERNRIAFSIFTEEYRRKVGCSDIDEDSHLLHAIQEDNRNTPMLAPTPWKHLPSKSS